MWSLLLFLICIKHSGPSIWESRPGIFSPFCYSLGFTTFLCDWRHTLDRGMTLTCCAGLFAEGERVPRYWAISDFGKVFFLCECVCVCVAHLPSLVACSWKQKVLFLTCNRCVCLTCVYIDSNFRVPFTFFFCFPFHQILANLSCVYVCVCVWRCVFMAICEKFRLGIFGRGPSTSKRCAQPSPAFSVFLFSSLFFLIDLGENCRPLSLHD